MKPDFFPPQPKISVVVPVYNVAKYLEEALNSIKNQSFKEWECILVDDGSKDNSGQVCDKFAEDDPRFKVIHKANGGLASARNAGLKEISGDYVVFIDSDDWVEPEYLDSLFSLITKYDADMAQIGYIKDFTTFSKTKHLVSEEIVIEGPAVMRELLKDKILPSFVWNKIYKKEVISVPFPEGRVYEDFTALTSWIKNLNRIAFSPSPLYHYRMRKGSITSVGNSKNQLDFIMAYQYRADMINKLDPESFSEKDKSIYLNRNFIKQAKLIARNKEEKVKRLETLKFLSHSLNKIEEPPIRELGFKKWMRGRMLRKNPELFMSLMRKVNTLDFHSRFRLKRYFE